MTVEYFLLCVLTWEMGMDMIRPAYMEYGISDISLQLYLFGRTCTTLHVQWLCYLLKNSPSFLLSFSSKLLLIPCPKSPNLGQFSNQDFNTMSRTPHVLPFFPLQ